MNGQTLGGRWLGIRMTDKAPGEKKETPKRCTGVFIRNLSWRIDKETVQETFRQCGNIKHVHFPRHPKTGGFIHFGNVEFYDEGGAERALKLAGTAVLGLPIKVEYPKFPHRK
ncbi:unnamed protein product [Choristocarpus tenellus]